MTRRETVVLTSESSSADAEHVASKKLRDSADQPPHPGNFRVSFFSLINRDITSPKELKFAEVCVVPAGLIVGSERTQSVLEFPFGDRCFTDLTLPL